MQSEHDPPSAPRMAQGPRLRPATAADRSFLLALFASTREPELAVLPDDATRRAFVEGQFDLQDRHYRTHYEGACFDVVEVGDVPVGRIYVHRRVDEIRLMEITIAPDWRRRGIAGRLVHDLISESESAGLPVGLHVEPDNQANAWYRRLGFRHVVDRGAYEFLMRDPAFGAAERPAGSAVS